MIASRRYGASDLFERGKGGKAVYGDIEYDNTYELGRLSQASRKAAGGWRFRHHRSWESRMLSAVWAGVTELVRKVASIKEPSIAPAHKRLSY